MSQLTLTTEIELSNITIHYPLLEIHEVSLVSYKNGETVIKKNYQTSIYAPGSDVSEASPQVQAFTSSIWTPEVIAAYEATLPPEPEELKPFVTPPPAP